MHKSTLIKKLIIITVLLTLNSIVFSKEKIPLYDYIRPLPSNFFNIPPSEVVDIFSFSITIQTQVPLFRLNDSYSYEPYLVSNFSVSNDELQYIFELKPALFHDNTMLKSIDVKNTFEYILRRSTMNNHDLLNIVGAKDFASKKSKSVKGIKVIDQKKFIINLIKKDPKFIEKLSEPRLSIWKKSGNNIVGLGNYKLKQITPIKMELEYHQNKIHEYKEAPKKILFKKMSYEDAISEYKKGLLSDLFFYKIKLEDKKEIEKMSNIYQMPFPRTYSLVLNSKTLSLNDRKKILSKVNSSDLVNTCYKGEKFTHNIIPPSFLGYDPKLKPISYVISKNHKIDKQVRIVVVNSIGSEICVRDYFKKRLKDLNAQIKVVNLDELVEDWPSNRVDGHFAYMESEVKTNYFDAFNPKINFTKGDHLATEYFKYYEKYEYETDLRKKYEYAKSFSNYIASRATFFPIFHQHHKMIINRKYILPHKYNLTAVQIPIYELKINE